MTQTESARSTDRFGNAIDPTAGYARGPVLRGIGDEVQRMLRGRALVRQRGLELGMDSLFLLTGVTRAFPLSAADLALLATQLSFYTHFDGKAEAPAVAYVGGSPDRHGACFANRVTAGMLATMLALGDRGQSALSVVPKGHGHPSIANACRVAGVGCEEVVGEADGLERIRGSAADFVILTTVTPQKHVFEEAAIRRIISAARAAGSEVILDDAHAAFRTAHFRQAPTLALGDVGVALLSMDKHLIGPRAALIAGKRDLVAKVAARMYQFGLEAPFANYAASIRAIDSYDPQRIAALATLAADLSSALRSRLSLADDQLYMAGPGIAVPEDDLASLACSRAGSAQPVLSPMEISSIVALRMVETHGLVTILAIGMPGSAAPLRVMLFPDGARAGVDTIVDSIEQAVAFAATLVDDAAAAREYLCGKSS